MSPEFQMAAYLTIAFVWWFCVYAIVYYHKQVKFPYQDWSGGDRVFCVLWGGFVAILWPISIPIFILIATYQLLKHIRVVAEFFGWPFYQYEMVLEDLADWFYKKRFRNG